MGLNDMHYGIKNLFYVYKISTNYTDNKGQYEFQLKVNNCVNVLS